jgi:hypothetical protein
MNRAERELQNKTSRVIASGWNDLAGFTNQKQQHPNRPTAELPNCPTVELQTPNHTKLQEGIKTGRTLAEVNVKEEDWRTRRCS